jgi:folate-binding Fe-S cluster repair protein YgfZ
VEGKPVGALGSVSGKQGLAIARIDRVKSALDNGRDILADGIPVTLAIPGWAKFTFPEGATAAENG